MAVILRSEGEQDVSKPIAQALKGICHYIETFVLVLFAFSKCSKLLEESDNLGLEFQVSYSSRINRNSNLGSRKEFMYLAAIQRDCLIRPATIRKICGVREKERETF